MKFRIMNEVTKEDKEEIFEKLLEYNLAHLEDKEPKEFAIYYEDDMLQKKAGIIGETHGKWLEVDFLWVEDSLRNQKIGSQLLLSAEKLAKERGCKYAFLNTFSFQAPNFYPKYGYQEVFVLEEYPVTGKRHYFTKEL